MTIDKAIERLINLEDQYDKAAKERGAIAERTTSPTLKLHNTKWQNYYNGKANGMHVARLLLLEVK